MTPKNHSPNPLLRFGTSSWTYPGWKNLVYFETYRSESSFNRESLAEYARNPLFQTVGIDSTFYRPPAVSTLLRYRSQVPKEFTFVVKAWERLGILTYPKHPRYGAHAGNANPDFLNPNVLEEFLKPFKEADFIPQLGILLLQFPSIPEEHHEHFLEKLDRFFQNSPEGLPYAVEIRSTKLLQPEYFTILNRHSVTHCFNHWSYMPSLREQMKRSAECGSLSAPRLITRILTPLGLSYENAVKKHAPYDKIKTPLPEMRRDVLLFCKRALERKVPAYIIVNNRAEGCAPLTIDAIFSQLPTDESDTPAS